MSNTQQAGNPTYVTRERNDDGCKAVSESTDVFFEVYSTSVYSRIFPKQTINLFDRKKTQDPIEEEDEISFRSLETLRPT